MINADVGDIVARNLCGAIMQLRVTRVTPRIIECGDWQFDRETGAEIDYFLNWGPPPLHTGSRLSDKVIESSTGAGVAPIGKHNAIFRR